MATAIRHALAYLAGRLFMSERKWDEADLIGQAAYGLAQRALKAKLPQLHYLLELASLEGAVQAARRRKQASKASGANVVKMRTIG